MFSAGRFLYTASLVPMLTNSCIVRSVPFFENQADRSNHRFPPACFYLAILRMLKIENMVVYHLPQIPGNSFRDLNGKRFCGSSRWKITGRNRNSEKVVPFSRLGSSEGKFVYHLQVSWVSFQSIAARQSGNFRQMVNDTYRSYRTKILNENIRNFLINGKQPKYVTGFSSVKTVPHKRQT